ncbi:unnamed protein product, partial [Symbiodinium microadriaticum]
AKRGPGNASPEPHACADSQLGAQGPALQGEDLHGTGAAGGRLRHLLQSVRCRADREQQEDGAISAALCDQQL